MLGRVRRARWRLEQAEAERVWALAFARAEGISVRKIAAEAGLSPTRVHQLTTDVDLPTLEEALGALRSCGWPAPEDPDASDDEELAGRALVADRLDDEVGWLRQCAEWLDHLEHKTFPPAANLRPEGDHPDRYHVVVNLARVGDILRRIAFDVEELARARRIEDLSVAAVNNDPRAERRRRLAEPDLTYAEFCDRTGTPWRSTQHGELAWTKYQIERKRQKCEERGQRLRPRQPGALRRCPQHPPEVGVSVCGSHLPQRVAEPGTHLLQMPDIGADRAIRQPCRRAGKHEPGQHIGLELGQLFWARR